MIRRLAVLAAALALPLFAGCAAPTDGIETTSDSTEALSGANGSTYVLTSFDGTDVIGLNNQGKTFTATYGSTTSFKLALLDKYIPVDPCRQAALDYNSYVGVNDTVSAGFTTALTTMASNACKAKVLLSSTNVMKTFQPSP